MSTLTIEEEGEVVEQKHSGFGIWAFVLSIVSAVAMFTVFVVAGVMEASTPGGIDETSAGAVVIGLCMLALMAVDLVAIGLGITGLLQRDRKKVLSILGVIFSALVILVTIVTIVIGNAAQAG